MRLRVPGPLAAAVVVMALAAPSCADNFRTMQQGIMSDLGATRPSVSPAYQRESNRDRIRRIPSVRHKDQMARYWERRQRQQALAGTNLKTLGEPLPLADFTAAAPTVGIGSVIHPTVYSYQAALENVLRIAVGDSVRFHDGGRHGSLSLLRTGKGEDGRTCRYFRRTITAPDGRAVDYGHACRLRDGSWRFDAG